MEEIKNCLQAALGGAHSVHLFFSQADRAIIDVGYDDFHYVAPLLIPRYQEHNTLHFVLTGCGTLEIEGQAFAAAAGDFFSVPSGVSFRYFPTEGEEWSYVWFGLAGESVEWLRRAGFSPTRPIRRAKDRQTVTARLSEMLLSCREDRTADYLYAKSVFLSLMAELTALHPTEERRPKDTPPTTHDTVTGVIRSLIDANYRNPALTVEMLCRIVHLSHPYVCKIFRRTAGHTVKAEIIERRMREARRLLSLGRRVKEVAEEVGYTDAAHFSKEFHRLYGYAPRAHLDPLSHHDAK